VKDRRGEREDKVEGGQEGRGKEEGKVGNLAPTIISKSWCLCAA